MCAGAGTSVSSRFSVNSTNHSGKSRNRSSDARLISLFFFLFRFFGESRQFPGARSSPRSVSGLEDAVDEYCGSDVEDELVPEFDNNPGTTRGTKFSVLQRIFFPCGVRCGFLPLAHSKVYPWSSQSFPNDRIAGVSSIPNR